MIAAVVNFVKRPNALFAADEIWFSSREGTRELDSGAGLPVLGEGAEQGMPTEYPINAVVENFVRIEQGFDSEKIRF